MSTPKKGRPNYEKWHPFWEIVRIGPNKIPKGPIPIAKVDETPSTAGRAEREMLTHHAYDTCSGQLVRWSSRQRTGGKDIVRPHPSDRWFQSQISSMCGGVFWECRRTVWGAFGECPGSVWRASGMCARRCPMCVWKD